MPKLAMTGDRRLLQRMLTNLLDNAILHSPSGTEVAVSLNRIANVTQLSVTDDGPGVTKDEAQVLLRRFARADRSRSTSSLGLGLALVSVIAGIHGGLIKISPRPGFGVDIAFSS